MRRVLTRAGMLVASAALVGSLGACGNATGPSVSFNAQDVASSVEDVASAFQSNQDAMSSMNVASAAIGANLAGQILDGGSGRFLPGADRAPAVIDNLLQRAIFPQNYLGITFVFDPQQGTYVQSSQTGAPANGVRIIYYATNPITHVPATPLNALGYVDLTDESSAASTRLGVTIVQTGSSDVTLADYYIDASYVQGDTSRSATLASVGYVSNGTQELDLNLSETLELTQSGVINITADYQASLKGQDTSVRFQGTGTLDLTGAPGTLDATFTLTKGADQVVLHATLAAAGSLDGTLKFNGAVVVNIAGTSDNPTFTNADGSAATGTQLTALKNIWDGIGEMFDVVGRLFGPATPSAG